MQAASRARVHPLGPIGRLAAILEGVLQGALGEDGHVRAREARLEAQEKELRDRERQLRAKEEDATAAEEEQER